MASEKRFTKPEWGWIMYDWANSVYYTIIGAAIFPIYFQSLAPIGDVWWGYGTSIATFVVALLAPVLGAIADYHGMKKKLFSVFLVVGVVFTSTMAIFDQWQLVLVGYIISFIGVMGSILFYDSFLTDVTTRERMDKVSATGFAMGYVGGSTIPFLISIALVFIMDSSALSIKLSVILTSFWWAVFSIPFLKNVKHTHSLGELPKGFISAAFKNVGHTFKDIVKRKGLFLFILAYFFYIDGVNTVIHMSTIYGATLGLDTIGMIAALLVTQLVAAPFSILFARLADKVGSIKMLLISVCVYFVICITGFYMGASLEPWQQDYYDVFDNAISTSEQTDEIAQLRSSGISILSTETRHDDMMAAIDEANLDSTAAAKLKTALSDYITTLDTEGSYDAALKRSNIMFWCMAVLVGTCQGGIQSLSRSYFGKLVPPKKSNEYFGFFDIFGKFAAVIGPALYAFLSNLTGRPSMGILSLMFLFVIGAVILVAGKKHFAAVEASVQQEL